MKQPWIAAQIVPGTGGAARGKGGPEAIPRAAETARLDALIVWPAADPILEDHLLAARAAGLRTYLWFPVLADLPGLPVENDDATISFDASRGHGRSGAWAGLYGGPETFLFACPGRTRYLERAQAIYRDLLARHDLDGVMLDRIRFPSPANGFEALFSCYCTACAGRFQEAYGRALPRPERLAAALRRFPPAPGLLAAAGCADLADFRAAAVHRVVEPFAALARSRGLTVGLDLFCPTLADFVGQDYRRLSGLCDWVKPMLYCHAVGPAGIPLEIACLWRALDALAAEARERAPAALRRVFGFDIPDEMNRLLHDGLPEATAGVEMDRLRARNLPDTIRVHAGIEAVRIPAFGVDITPAVLDRYLEAIAGRCDGLVASWNLLAMPRENLRLLGALKDSTG
jgi:hypothetical protein